MSLSRTDSVPPISRATDRIKARLRPQPGPRFIHPKARDLINEDSDHDANLDVAEDSAHHYLDWIATRCQPHLGQSVLEVGAGTGSITERFAAGRSVVAIDRSAWCVDQMNARFDGVANVEVRQVDVADLVSEPNRFDSVVMLNVLEHIEDDVGALRMLSSLLQPDGRIVIYVPALNGLYGPWDHKVGHYRRYSRWRMREVLDEAGLEPVELRYMNALSIPAWWAFSKTDVERSSAGNISLWDRTGIRAGRRIESVLPVPVGLNVFCAARIRR